MQNKRWVLIKIIQHRKYAPARKIGNQETY